MSRSHSPRRGPGLDGPVRSADPARRPRSRRRAVGGTASALTNGSSSTRVLSSIKSRASGAGAGRRPRQVGGGPGQQHEADAGVRRRRPSARIGSSAGSSGARPAAAPPQVGPGAAIRATRGRFVSVPRRAGLASAANRSGPRRPSRAVRRAGSPGGSTTGRPRRVASVTGSTSAAASLDPAGPGQGLGHVGAQHGRAVVSRSQALGGRAVRSRGHDLVRRRAGDEQQVGVAHRQSHVALGVGCRGRSRGLLDPWRGPPQVARRWPRATPADASICRAGRARRSARPTSAPRRRRSARASLSRPSGAAIRRCMSQSPTSPLARRARLVGRDGAVREVEPARARPARRGSSAGPARTPPASSGVSSGTSRRRPLGMRPRPARMSHVGAGPRWRAVGVGTAQGGSPAWSSVSGHSSSTRSHCSASCRREARQRPRAPPGSASAISCSASPARCQCSATSAGAGSVRRPRASASRRCTSPPPPGHQAAPDRLGEQRVPQLRPSRSRRRASSRRSSSSCRPRSARRRRARCPRQQVVRQRTVRDARAPGDRPRRRRRGRPSRWSSRSASSRGSGSPSSACAASCSVNSGWPARPRGGSGRPRPRSRLGPEQQGSCSAVSSRVSGASSSSPTAGSAPDPREPVADGRGASRVVVCARCRPPARPGRGSAGARAGPGSWRPPSAGPR